MHDNYTYLSWTQDIFKLLACARRELTTRGHNDSRLRSLVSSKLSKDPKVKAIYKENAGSSCSLRSLYGKKGNDKKIEEL